MKLSLPIYLLLLFVVYGCNKSVDHRNNSVNLIIGDLSYQSKFGYTPNAQVDQNLRIKTHLEYVENLLRKKNTSNLSLELQAKRSKILDLLNQYWANGLFPRNYDYADERKPCFMDKDGTICAVGYLIEQTTNRQVAEDINRKFKYHEILAINAPVFDNWISAHGITKMECAMIQPTYNGWNRGEKLRKCPDEWIVHKESMTNRTLDEYYVLDQKKMHMSNFDSNWLKVNCKLYRKYVYHY